MYLLNGDDIVERSLLLLMGERTRLLQNDNKHVGFTIDGIIMKIEQIADIMQRLRRQWTVYYTSPKSFYNNLLWGPLIGWIIKLIVQTFQSLI